MGVLWRDRRGTVAIVAAAGMAAILGVTGFAIDLGIAYTQKAMLQKVADSAALAGAITWSKSSSSTAVTAAIKDIVAANGLPTSVIVTSGTGYLASSPKDTGTKAVQVSLSESSPLSLTQAITSLTSVTTTAYALAEIGSTTGTAACLLALQTLMVNSTINATGCAVQANGTASNAITVNSGGSITAANINTPGGIVKNGTITGTITTGAPTVADPYSGAQSAASQGFTNCQNYNNQTTLSTPGCYSNVNLNGTSLTLTGSGTNGGTYYFTNINVNSGGSITGTNVTMVTENNFSPNGNITLTAPTGGPFNGIAMYAMGGINFNSGVVFKINGAVYAPTSTLIPDSGAFNSSACTYLVAQYITFNSGSNVTLPQVNCSSYGFNHPSLKGPATIALVQ
jgi:Flp pilus assembly protein TadG